MSKRTIAIGDIHGCAEALRILLDAIDPQPQDTLITLGDYVDRGPQSSEVVEMLVEMPSRCQLIPLLGNHEIMMLSALQSRQDMGFWLQCGGDTTVASYGGDLANVPQHHHMFFRHCRLFYEIDSHFFIHANYAHDLPLEEQPEELAFWEHIDEEIPPPHDNGKIAVVGHSPQADGAIHDMGHLILLDTYCFGGMWLSALDVVNGTVWQASEDGRLRTMDVPTEPAEG